MKKFCGTIWLAWAIACSSLSAGQFDLWHQRHPIPLGNGLRAVTFGKANYVAVGEDGAIITSGDGTKWAVQPIPEPDFFLGVAYGMNAFVAVSIQGNIWQSEDGADWELAFRRTGASFQGVAYGNSMFLAFGSNEVITSTDSTNWIARPLDLEVSDCIGFEDGLFWANARSGDKLFTSTDGVNWTPHTLPAFAIPSALAYGRGVFVAVDFGSILRSTDRFDSALVIADVPAVFYGVAFGSEKFVAVGFENSPGSNANRGAVFTSLDGIAWTKQTINEADELMAVIFNRTEFIAVSEKGQVYSSSDGEVWTARSKGPRASLYGGAYGQNQFVVVGELGTILTSPTGLDWTIQMSGLTNSLNSVVFGDGTWVAVGANGTVASSPDGITWNATSVSETAFLSSVTFQSGLFVAVGSDGPLFSEFSGAIWSSPDGLAWQRREVFCPLCSVGNFRDVVYAVEQQAFVAVGWGSAAGSNDGVIWHTLDQSPLGSAITYGNGLMMVANDGSILTAVRGDQWTNTFVSSDSSFIDVACFKGSFLAVGRPLLDPYTSVKAMWSPDGQAWTEIKAVNSPSLSRIIVGPDCVLLIGEAGTILQSDTTPFRLQFETVQANFTHFTARLSMESARTVRIESSTNLVDWSPVTVINQPDNTFPFSEALTPNLPQKYYRAVAY